MKYRALPRQDSGWTAVQGQDANLRPWTRQTTAGFEPLTEAGHGRQSEGGHPAALDSLAAIGSGVLVHLAFPVALAPAGVAMALGAVLIAASVVLVVAAARELARARTAFDVRKPTTALVDTGVFRFSRNPVYFSMMLLCLGIALAANSLAMVLLSLPAGRLLCRLVIRPEERYLEEKFGKDYRAYKAAVRRWI